MKFTKEKLEEITEDTKEELEIKKQEVTERARKVMLFEGIGILGFYALGMVGMVALSMNSDLTKETIEQITSGYFIIGALHYCGVLGTQIRAMDKVYFPKK